MIEIPDLNVDSKQVMDSRNKQLTPIDGNWDPWKQSNITTFDFEAMNWTDPIAVGFYDGDNYTEYTLDMYDTTEDMLTDIVEEMLKPKHEGTRYTAHNLDYDIGHLINPIDQWVETKNKNSGMNQEYEYSILQTANSIIYMEIREINYKGPSGKVSHTRKWTIQDSYHLLMLSLDEAIEAFTNMDGKDDFNVEAIDKPPVMKENNTWDEMREYLKTDCKGTYEAIIGFRNKLENSLGEDIDLGLTAASTAMGVYRQKYLDNPIPGSSGKQEKLARLAYVGGRTEVFKQYFNGNKHTNDTLKHYDVNSLYPHIYTNMKHPIGKPITKNTDRIDNPKEKLKEIVAEGYGGMVTAKVDIPKQTYTTLPIRAKMEGRDYEKSIFPSGRFTSTFMIRELIRSINWDNTEILEIQELVVSELGYLANEMGTDLYSMKKDIDGEKNPGKYSAIKLILNSFWGKLGMGREQEKVIKKPQLGDDMIPLGNGIDEQLRNTDRGIGKEKEKADSSYIIPRIAASVASQARVCMTQWIEMIEDKGGEIWYMDTDSLVTDVDLPTGDDLGEMDLENELEKGIFLQPKTYTEVNVNQSNTIKAKGIQSKAQEKLTIDNYETILNGGSISVKWEAPVGGKVALKEGEFTPNVYDREIDGTDDKRNHISKTESKPHHFGKEYYRKLTEKKNKEKQAREAREMHRKGWEQLTFEAEVDTEALYDSEISAAENKTMLQKRRKHEGTKHIQG